MSNSDSMPSMSVADVAARAVAEDSQMILLDVREPHEFKLATLGEGVEVAPLSELSQVGADALPEAIKADKSAEIVVLCHHGARSAQVVAWLMQQGYTNVFNMSGGIHAWALEVDSTVGQY